MNKKQKIEIVETLEILSPHVDSPRTYITPLSEAYKNGDMEMVRLLLADPTVALEDEEQWLVDKIIEMIIDEKDVELVEILLKHPLVDPITLGNYVLREACRHGYIEMVKLFLSDPRVDPTCENDGTPLSEACENGHVEVVKLLLADPRVDPSRYDHGLSNYAISLACKNGHVEVVKLLLADPRVDPSREDRHGLSNNAIGLACKNNHVEVVKLLLVDLRVDPSRYDHGLNNSAIGLASERGYLEMVKLLWTDSRVDPSSEDNHVIKIACKNGHVEVAKLLLTDPRVVLTQKHYITMLLTALLNCRHKIAELLYPKIAPSTEKQVFAFIIASITGKIKYVKYVLQNLKNINPASYNNLAIIRACDNGHVEVVKLLLTDPRVNPADRGNVAFIRACENGRVEVVKLLLTNPRVDPVVRDNIAFIKACENGRVEVVKLLLTDPRVNPADRGNVAFIRACENGRVEVVKLLLTNPRVDPVCKEDSSHIPTSIILRHPELNEKFEFYFKSDHNLAISKACENGHVEVIKVLLRDQRIDPTDDSNRALVCASLFGRYKVIELLLEDPRVLNSDLTFLKKLVPGLYIQYVIRKKYAISRIKEWWMSIIHHPEHPFFLKEITKELADQN